MNDELYSQAKRAADELCVAADLKPGDIMVVGWRLSAANTLTARS